MYQTLRIWSTWTWKVLSYQVLLDKNENPPLAHHNSPATIVPEVRMVTTTPYKFGETT